MATATKIPKINLRSNKFLIAILFIVAAVVFVGMLGLLKNLYETETYYVLKEDVGTRSKISADMLQAVTTASGTGPKAAKTVADVQKGFLYSKYPLLKGDILTNSNVGPFQDISAGVPDEWVVTSFGVPADSAVGGRIRRGVYFDMMVAQQEASFYPFVNVLALDTSISLNSASSANAANTSEAKNGQTSQYVVAMPPGDAARLQQIMAKYSGNIKLLLSPRQNEYAAPRLIDYNGEFKYEGTPKNMGKGTDYTFSTVERDEFGRPVGDDSNCSVGNAKLSKEQCNKIGDVNTEENVELTPITPPDADQASPSNTQAENENDDNKTQESSPSAVEGENS